MASQNPYQSPSHRQSPASPAGAVVCEVKPVFWMRIFWRLTSLIFAVGLLTVPGALYANSAIPIPGRLIGVGGVAFFLFLGAAMACLNSMARIRVFHNGLEILEGGSKFFLWSEIARIRLGQELDLELVVGTRVSGSFTLSSAERERLTAAIQESIDDAGKLGV